MLIHSGDTDGAFAALRFVAGHRLDYSDRAVVAVSSEIDDHYAPSSTSLVEVSPYLAFLHLDSFLSHVAHFVSDVGGSGT